MAELSTVVSLGAPKAEVKITTARTRSQTSKWNRTQETTTIQMLGLRISLKIHKLHTILLNKRDWIQGKNRGICRWATQIRWIDPKTLSFKETLWAKMLKVCLIEILPSTKQWAQTSKPLSHWSHHNELILSNLTEHKTLTPHCDSAK